MVILHAFVLDDEFKFKTHLRLEFLQVEIPAPHILHIGERLPNPRDRRVEGSFDDQWPVFGRQMMFRFSVFRSSHDSPSGGYFALSSGCRIPKTLPAGPSA